MIRKRIGRAALSAVLAAALMLPMAAAVSYGDTGGHWAEPAITRWSDRGVIQGSGGQFRPGGSITRGEMAAILQRVMNYQTVAPNTYTDLPDGEWYAKPILAVSAAGVMQGAGGKVRPTDPITRQEAAVLLAGAFNLDAYSSTNLFAYDDHLQIADWAAEAVKTMTVLEFMKGANGLFRPNDHITRAEAVQLLDNMVSGYYNAAGTYTGTVDGTVLVNTGGVTLQDMTINGSLYVTAGAVGSPVVLRNVTVRGKIINQSGQPIEGADGAVEELPPPEVDTGKENQKQWPAGSIRGIDVSSHQKDIDWAKVAADGVEFAMLRVGYTGYGTGSINLDKYFHQNIQGAQANGIPVGVYYFSQAISVEEALKEVQLVLDNLSGYTLQCPVVFDWETISGADGRANDLDTQTLCDAANAFCGAVAAQGYTPMVYFNKKLATDHYDLTQISQYDFWYAYYQKEAEIPGGYPYTMWQFTSSGKVNGIEGNVDLNAGYYRYWE